MAFTFDAIFAVDPANPANVAKNASITIFDPADVNQSPVAIQDPTGSPLPNPMTLDAAGMGPAFQHPTLARVGWKGAGFVGYFTSYEGMLNETVAAKDAALEAAAEAADAATVRLDELIAAGSFEGPAGPITNLTVGTVEAVGGNPLTDEIVASEVQYGAATVAALNATYGAKDLPANAGARAKFYNPQTNVYNKKASNTRKLRAKLAAAYGGAGLAKLGFIGDSKTAGQSAAFSTESWPMRLRSMLLADGYSAGGGIVTGNNNYVPGDSRWTFTGAWIRNTTDKPSASINTSGATALFTSDVAGTAVDIYTYGTTGGFTYSIDGGAAVAIVPNGASSLQTITVTGLANTTHTVLITTTSTTTTFVTGVGVRAASGLWVANLGVGGSKSSDWNSSAYFQNRHLASSLGLDAAFISLGVNDARNSVTAATYKTNMQSIISTLQAAGVEIHFVVPSPPNPATITAVLWDSFVSAMYDLADQYDAPLIDLSHRYGSWAQGNTLGLFTDDLHENKAGYAFNAAGVKALLS